MCLLLLGYNKVSGTSFGLLENVVKTRGRKPGAHDVTRTLSAVSAEPQRVCIESRCCTNSCSLSNQSYKLKDTKETSVAAGGRNHVKIKITAALS